MEVGDIVKIKAPGGGYWEGKITKITDAFRHCFRDRSETVLPYSQPIATVKGKGFAVVMELNLRKEDGVWFEK